MLIFYSASSQNAWSSEGGGSTRLGDEMYDGYEVKHFGGGYRSETKIAY